MFSVHPVHIDVGVVVEDILKHVAGHGEFHIILLAQGVENVIHPLLVVRVPLLGPGHGLDGNDAALAGQGDDPARILQSFLLAGAGGVGRLLHHHVVKAAVDEGKAQFGELLVVPAVGDAGVGLHGHLHILAPFFADVGKNLGHIVVEGMAVAEEQDFHGDSSFYFVDKSIIHGEIQGVNGAKRRGNQPKSG